MSERRGMNLSLNILTTLTARAILLGLALVSSVLLARVLGPEGRGLFALALLLPEWSKNLGLLGFEQANAVYAGLEPGRRRALVWQSAVIAAVVGGVFAVGAVSFLSLGAPGVPALRQGPRWLFLLPLAVIPVGLTAEYWFAILRGMNRILLLNVVEVATKVASVLLILVFLVGFRLGVAGAVWADVLGCLGTVTVIGLLLRRVGVWGRPVLDRALWRRTAGFALPAYGGTAAAYTNYRAGEFIIVVLLSPTDLGFYVIAVSLAERLWVLTGAVGNALLPHLTNSPRRDPMLSAAIARHVMLWTGAACLVMFLLADAITEVLFSSAFAQTAAPLRWLLPGIFTLSVGKVLVAELLAREKPSYASWATGVAMVVNLAGSLVLVPRLGISGAAIASSISYTVLSLIVTWCYLRETGAGWSWLVPRRDDLLAYTSLWRRLTVAVGLT
jgi:O-antigen/teichoic acid export membrane protein